MRQPGVSQHLSSPRRGKEIVDLGELRISDASGPTLATNPLGASVVVVMVDLEAKIGGLLHFMLPDSSLDSKRSGSQPELFGDTGIEELSALMERRGAELSEIKVFLVGGADPTLEGPSSDSGSLGARNLATAREVLADKGYAISDERTGSNVSRSVVLDVSRLSITVQHPQAKEELL